MSSPTPPALTTLRTFSLAMTGGVVILLVAGFFIAPEIVLPPLWVWAVLLGLVAVAGLGAYLLADQLGRAASGARLSELAGKVFSVHIMRCALFELPVLVAFVLMFMQEEPSWVTLAIAALPSVILMLALVYPHESVLRHYQDRLDAGGPPTQFADRMLGRTVWAVDGGPSQSFPGQTFPG